MRVCLIVVLAMIATPARAQPVEHSIATVMDHRWAVEFLVGGGTFTANEPETPFLGVALIELALRFRLRPDLEVGLIGKGGGGITTKVSEAGIYADVRYRIQAERPWNGFVALGVGVETFYARPSNDVEMEPRAALRFGVGIERRFRTWSLEGAIQVTAIDSNRDVPAVDPATTEYKVERFAAVGVSASLGVIKYF